HPFMNIVGSALLLGALVATPAAASDPPLAATPDGYHASENSTLAVPATSGVLANDTSAKRAFLSATTVHGTLTLQRDGSFTYRSVAGYRGWDAFTYRAGAATGYYLTPPVPVYLY